MKNKPDPKGNYIATILILGIILGSLVVNGIQSKWSFFDSFIIKVDIGDIYENQLTRNRFQVTEAHLGKFYIDSLKKVVNAEVSDFINSGHPKEADQLRKALNQYISTLKPYNTYFKCNDLSEFITKQNLGIIDYEDLNMKLYKKIN